MNAFAQDAAKAQKQHLRQHLSEDVPQAACVAFRKHTAFNKVLFKTGPIAEKEARLAAISASAAIRCEYRINAQVMLAKKAGASDDRPKRLSKSLARFLVSQSCSTATSSAGKAEEDRHEDDGPKEK